MKKRNLFFMSILLAFGLSACGSSPGVKNSTSEPPAETAETSQTAAAEEEGTESEPSETAEMTTEEGTHPTAEGTSNVLIAYFSVPEDVDTSSTDAVAGASLVVRDEEKLGNTEYVAKLIQETVGGDLFRIETVEPYPLDHEPLVDQAADEQDEDLRPELTAHIENFDQYEYVFLGFPNWWADMPKPLYTFLEEYDFSSKTIIPFVTHGGSGASGTLDTISRLQPNALMSDHELVLSRSDVADSEDTVMTWADGLGINAKTE